MPEISKEVFAAWADVNGIKASDEYLEQLRGEVQAILARLEPLDDIDVSEIATEEAGLRHDGGTE